MRPKIHWITPSNVDCVPNNFEFPPRCDQSLQFRIQIEAKQLKFSANRNVPFNSPGRPCVHNTFWCAFASVPSQCDSFDAVLSCTSVCVVQINWISCEMEARTAHTRAYTYFRLQFPHHETEKKKTSTTQNYIYRRVRVGCIFRCRAPKTMPYLWVFYSNFPFIDRREKNAPHKCSRHTHTCSPNIPNGSETTFRFIFSFIHPPSAVHVHCGGRRISCAEHWATTNEHHICEKWPAAIYRFLLS